jgi:hypothetical protein
MAKTVANKPQQLGDSQWLLTWQGSNRTDVVTAVLGSEQMRVSPFDRNSSIASFAKPDEQSNGLLIDLGRAPSTVTTIEFTFDVISEGDRAWTIEGLSTGEVWQNDSVKVPADAPCLILSLERNEGGWQVVAREKILGEQGDITVDEQIPESYQELVARATARGLAEDSMSFTAVVDITPSMHDAHEDGSIQKILNCLVAIGASANNRPIDVSFHGVHDLKISVDDEIAGVYLGALAAATKAVQSAKPLHSLVPALAQSLKTNSTLYVVTDSMFFVEEDIVDELAAAGTKIRVLLTGTDAPRFNLMENSFFKILQVGALQGLDARGTMDLLS